MGKHPIIQNYRCRYINFIFKLLRFFFTLSLLAFTFLLIIMLELCKYWGAVMFYFNLLINVYAGAFVGDSFCPKGFVLLGGQKVKYTWVFWKLCIKMGCTLYSGAHYTQVNMVYLHITYKNCFPTLSGKKGTVLKLSLTVFDNSKSLSSLRFY